MACSSRVAKALLAMCLLCAGCADLKKMEDSMQKSTEAIGHNTESIQASSIAINANTEAIKQTSEQMQEQLSLLKKIGSYPVILSLLIFLFISILVLVIFFLVYSIICLKRAKSFFDFYKKENPLR